MKGKQILAAILACCFSVFALTGCSEKVSTKEKGAEVQAASEERYYQPTEVVTLTKEESSICVEDVVEVFEETAVEVLSYTTVPFEEAYVNGWGVQVSGYSEATVVTLLVECEQENDVLLISDIALMNRDGALPEGQTTYLGHWDNRDKNARIYILRVPGKVEVSDSCIVLKNTEVQKDPILYAKSFAADTPDYAHLEELFMRHAGPGTGIYLLKDRYYLNISNESLDAGSTHTTSSVLQAHAFIPLDSHLTKTLDASDVDMYVGLEVDGISYSISVNGDEYSDPQALPCQTLICVKTTRTYLTEEKRIESQSTEYKEFRLFVENAILEVECSDGSVTRFMAST